MNKQYYHISTKGTSADLFLDEEDFRQIVFILALVLCRNSGIEVVAYCIMNNHIHIIVYGTAETIEKRFLELKKMYSMWYANKYGKSKMPSTTLGPLFQHISETNGLSQIPARR